MRPIGRDHRNVDRASRPKSLLVEKDHRVDCAHISTAMQQETDLLEVLTTNKAYVLGLFFREYPHKWLFHEVDRITWL